jgi:hypothetical protein
MIHSRFRWLIAGFLPKRLLRLRGSIRNSLATACNRCRTDLPRVLIASDGQVSGYSKTMPAAATRPTGKRSRRGRLSEGAPTKQTAEVIEKISHAIALGLADDEAAAFSGIDDVTLTRWKRDPEFCRKIKNAVSTRLAMRLSKIESGADGWQGTAWLLERLYPSRFSRSGKVCQVSA